MFKLTIITREVFDWRGSLDATFLGHFADALFSLQKHIEMWHLPIPRLE